MIVPLFLSEASAFVASFHRHNKPPTGGLFACGSSNGTELVGVAIVGRPVSRHMQDGSTVEVVRCCTRDVAPKGTCSELYAACWRAARALGWRRIITYTLQSESGASLRGAGWRILAEREGADPARWQSRAGREWQSVVGQAKLLWGTAA
ncbi:XF1762 family protein [Gluconacetobacter diazotrophicus]|uniref:XF1762 family protein n=1 Tax=Gluconacetobacter diazotrophicus TaxID=33996 RepID=UPI0036F24F02